MFEKQITVSKYNANGNDFVIFHSIYRRDFSKFAISVCDRNKGIGADGLVVIFPHTKQSSNHIDFRWDFYNTDGTKASMCGNASRAVAHYAFYNSLTKSHNISFLSDVGIIKTKVYPNTNLVQTTMIEHKEKKLPFKKDGYIWWMVDTGVPHLVTIIKDIKKFDIEIAKKMRKKYNANVNFISISSKKEMHIRTYERGVEGETLACGTGMCAGFLWILKKNLVLKKHIIAIPYSKEPVKLSVLKGRASLEANVSYVFSATLPLDTI